MPSTPSITLWSHAAKRFFVRTEQRTVEVLPRGDGAFVAQLPELIHGSRYTIHRDTLHSAPLLDPRSRAVDGAHNVWVESEQPSAARSRPKFPWAQTLIYEAHVKGLTKRHPEIPPEFAGTYAALGHPALIEHLLALGVTTLELLPIFHFVDAPRLQRLGLVNYWGYAPVVFHAPSARYRASGTVEDTVDELKQAVEALHRAGIEVILDVVYNHSGEDGVDGTTDSLRALDPDSYFQKHPDGSWLNVTGCGNTLAASHPFVQDLVLSSLTYFADDIGVDGFRFDLATTLGRAPWDYSARAELLQKITQHPSLRDLKLISEPWDVGHGGYQLGQFPEPFVEWNDRYRDLARRVARGDGGTLAQFADAWMGSQRVFASRAPLASVNFVTSHDGMTLRDVTSFAHKHNHANGENGADGVHENWSSNAGQEGLQNESPSLLQQRQRRMLNLATLLFTSQGVPMWLAGDEFGQTQQGNNNAYCQDNETSWLSWDSSWRAFAIAIARLSGLRRALPALRRVKVPTEQEVRWLTLEGKPFTATDWESAHPQAIVCLHVGVVAIVFNPTEREQKMYIPEATGEWTLVFDTSCMDSAQRETVTGSRTVPRDCALIFTIV